MVSQRIIKFLDFNSFINHNETIFFIFLLIVVIYTYSQRSVHVNTDDMVDNIFPGCCSNMVTVLVTALIHC